MSAPRAALLLAGPSALLPLAGRTLLDRALDRLAEAGIARVVVAAAAPVEGLGAQLRARAAPPGILLPPEAMPSDPGAAVASALAAGLLPREAPFFVVAGDAVWFDGPVPALARLAGAFAPGRAEAVLLAGRAADLRSEVGRGDFLLDPMGVPRRPAAHEVAPFVFAGVQLLSPALVDPNSPGLDRTWDRAIAAGRMRAIVHDGIVLRLATARDRDEAESGIEERLGGFVA